LIYFFGAIDRNQPVIPFIIWRWLKRLPSLNFALIKNLETSVKRAPGCKKPL